MRTVLSFDEIDEKQRPLAGGKGGTLSRLHREGYPVPDGFVVLTTSFGDEGLSPEAWAQAREKLGELRREAPGSSFAVRSSALSEDSGQTSFAGEFETILGVRGEEEVLQAINAVWGSMRSERVRAYSKVHGVEDEHEMAVVVQRLVSSEYAGVVFTVDPVSGQSASMAGNYVHGLGDKLVSGESDAQPFTLTRPTGGYQGPDELKPYAKSLYELAERLERSLGSPQDIEWAVADGGVHLLQSRPITTLLTHDPNTGYWNDSLSRDHLWAGMGMCENLPGIMAPSTWSLWQIFFNELAEWKVGDNIYVGNIAGHPYMNYSIIYSVPNKIYGEKRARELLEPAFGFKPSMHIPEIKITWRNLLIEIMPNEVRWQLKVRRLAKEVPGFIAGNPEKCKSLVKLIREADSPARIFELWSTEVKPLFMMSGWMLKALNELYGVPWISLSNEVATLVGKEDADLLMSTMGGLSEELASMGVLTGISKVHSGEMTVEEYMESYGHRFRDEWHLDKPRPYENPAWLEEKLEDYDKNPFDVESIARRRQKEYEEAWRRLMERHKGKASSVKRKLEHFASLSLDREHVRSEITRSVCVVRELYLKAGGLLGIGDDVFHLYYRELMGALKGETAALRQIPSRKRMHARLEKLPPYPALICGPFDPFRWASDSARRSDIYDAHAPVAAVEGSDTIKGNPGSGGRAEGRVRIINSPEEGDALLPGEILVTSTTNVEWTPLFPRAAAVVTDIGMPLAHAAIVARELGIPAVVGCGNATTRLKTGDRVLVDGGQGIVKILASLKA